MKRPTHVLVARSDGEKLTGEEWMTLEDFAKLFTWGKTMYTTGRDGGPGTALMAERNDIRVRPADERGEDRE